MAFRRRGYVEENEFVGPHPVVDTGLLDGVPRIPKIDKIDAFDNPSIFHIQARDDPFC